MVASTFLGTCQSASVLDTQINGVPSDRVARVPALSSTSRPLRFLTMAQPVLAAIGAAKAVRARGTDAGDWLVTISVDGSTAAMSMDVDVYTTEADARAVSAYTLAAPAADAATLAAYNAALARRKLQLVGITKHGLRAIARSFAGGKERGHAIVCSFAGRGVW